MHKEIFRPSYTQLLPPVLSGSTLKIIAIATMLIDHIGAVILEIGYLLPYNNHLMSTLSYEASEQIWHLDRMLRTVGRISFPIFCFLLVEGFFHTSNRQKYLGRLAVFALLSEIPFDLCFNDAILEFSYQNVMFTLLIGLLAITFMDKAREKLPALALLPAAAGLALGYVMQTDYDWKGVLLIIVLYLFHSFPLERTVAGCLCLLWESAACLAFIPLNLYNGRRGRKIKYVFYLFYPIHLFLLFLIRYMIFHY